MAITKLPGRRRADFSQNDKISRCFLENMDWDKIVREREARAQREAELQKYEQETYERERVKFRDFPEWTVETVCDENLIVATLSVSKTETGYHGAYRRARYAKFVNPSNEKILQTFTVDGTTIPDVLREFILKVRDRYLTTLTDEQLEQHIAEVVQRYTENPYCRSLMQYSETKEFLANEKRLEEIKKHKEYIAKERQNLEYAAEQFAKREKTLKDLLSELERLIASPESTS